MTIDPFLIAVGLIGNKELTDELLNHVLGVVSGLAPDLDAAAIEVVRKQLESSIGVSMSVGQGLHGGDVAPWLHDVKASIQWTYWNAYVNQLKSKNFSPGVLRVLDEDTDNILTECGNPMETGSWSPKGLVMGDVQSGKTANYCGLISKAADAGYKVIVLLTGMIEDLRSQSQERLDEGFVGRDSRQLLTGNRNANPIGAGRFSQKTPNVLTSIESDFLRANYQALGGIPIANISEPVLLVMKKNVAPLTNVIGFLDSQMKQGTTRLNLPLLLIDDEADNASVNARKDGDPAAINKLIRELLKRFSRASYVGYTATPFANVFINPDIEDLFPSNFIYALSTPSNYLGVASYFSDSGSHSGFVEDITDAEALLPYKHTKSFLVPALPESMKDAVGVFLLSCTIRDLRKEPLRHRSMLINASRFTDVQGRISETLKGDLYLLTEDIKQYLAGDRWAAHPRLEKLFALWLDHYQDCGFAWDTVRGALYESISTLKVVTINQKSEETERLNYTQYNSSRYGRRVIAVGGLTLSRGLTLEGLCVSYFYRNSKAYDTLLQMGRWFGYRPGYDDLCRVWVDPLAKQWYRHLSDVVEELRHDIRRMHANRQPPSKFGLRVRAHPDALIVTALNKMRNANKVEIAVSYSAFGAETPLLPEDAKRNNLNVDQVATFLQGLDPAEMIGQRLYWPRIDKGRIAHFLSELEILDLNSHFMRDISGKSRPLLDFIANNQLPELREWDVCMPQGKGGALETLLVRTREKGTVRVQPRDRQFERVRKGGGFLRLNKQRVGEVADEQVGFEKTLLAEVTAKWEDEKKIDPKLGVTAPGYFYRQFRDRPLLTIHVIEPVDPKKEERRKTMLTKAEIEPKVLIAISVSFPKFEGEGSSVVYALNKVALRGAGLLAEEDDDEDAD